MTAVAAATDSAEALEHGTKRAQTLLDKLLFCEARSVYCEVLRLARDAPRRVDGSRSTTAERATVAALSGLAESFSRQSRTQLSANDSDHHASVPWLRLNVQVSY